MSQRCRHAALVGTSFLLLPALVTTILSVAPYAIVGVGAQRDELATCNVKNRRRRGGFLRTVTKKCWCVPTHADGSPNLSAKCPRMSKNTSANMANSVRKSRAYRSFRYTCLQGARYSLVNGGTQCNPFTSQCPAPPGAQSGAVCGVIYKDKSCRRRRYGLKTFPSLKALQNDGTAVLTHIGNCGVCSTLQDLSVYMDQPNTSTKLATCAGKVLSGGEDGIFDCYRAAGLTQQCARLWAQNIMAVAKECITPCLPALNDISLLDNDPNKCVVHECLKCRDKATGEVMKKYAGRTVTNSHIRSAALEQCSVLGKSKMVGHNPCINTKYDPNLSC